MAISLNKPKLDNLASDIWKSAERLRGKFKAYEYQGVILPIIVIRRLECVLLTWREAKRAEVLAKRPKLTEKELAKLVKELELNPKQSPFSNKTDWTLRKVYEEDHALLEENFRKYINGFSKNVDDIIEDEYEPGGKVLKNRLGIRSKKEIDRLEYARLLKTQLHYYKVIKPNTQFSNPLICEMHQYWMGSIYEWAGKYRTVNLGKSGFLSPPAYLVDQNMSGFEKDFLQRYTPCRPRTINQVAQDLAKVHAEFLLVHPFRDGNGRMARLITILMALQAGYPAPDFGFPIYKNRRKYLTAVTKGYVQDYELLATDIKEAIERSKKLSVS